MAAEMVAASSNHMDGRPAPAALITVAATAIRAASAERGGCGDGPGSVPTGAGVRTWLNGVRCR
ncbi:hypothetical protein MHIB_12590 [Mycolicibacter hiberniae]|uniref:Uncharacterized protein n=1 Tax=Mycolicibacter hiberniae TaxID=29314 RepID=A0A7I7X1Z9_9MYCO|nr:hypothetical protein MHIB_12590 [Mycolicibacter hiberniae]